MACVVGRRRSSVGAAQVDAFVVSPRVEGLAEGPVQLAAQSCLDGGEDLDAVSEFVDGDGVALGPSLPRLGGGQRCAPTRGVDESTSRIGWTGRGDGGRCDPCRHLERVVRPVRMVLMNSICPGQRVALSIRCCSMTARSAALGADRV